MDTKPRGPLGPGVSLHRRGKEVGSVADMIRLLGMKFFGRHGVFKEEQVLGQRFEVDAEFRVDLAAAGKSDDLRETVNYAEVYDRIKQVMETEVFQLIETCAERIAAEILSNDRVKRVRVRVRKPHVALGGILDAVEVEIEREAE